MSRAGRAQANGPGDQGLATKRRRSDDDSSERPRGGQNRRGSHAGETTLQRDGRRSSVGPALRAVLGSMVQKRKRPARNSPSRLAELRSERQAEAADPSQWTQLGLARKIGASVRSVKAWRQARPCRACSIGAASRRRSASASPNSDSDLPNRPSDSRCAWIIGRWDRSLGKCARDPVTRRHEHALSARFLRPTARTRR